MNRIWKLSQGTAGVDKDGFAAGEGIFELHMNRTVPRRQRTNPPQGVIGEGAETLYGHSLHHMDVRDSEILISTFLRI